MLSFNNRLGASSVGTMSPSVLGLLLCFLFSLLFSPAALQAEHRYSRPEAIEANSPSASKTASISQEKRQPKRESAFSDVLAVLVILTLIISFFLLPISWLVYTIAGLNTWLFIVLGNTAFLYVLGFLALPFVETKGERILIGFFMGLFAVITGLFGLIAGLIQGPLWLWAGSIGLIVLGVIFFILMLRGLIIYYKEENKEEKPQFFSRR